MSMWNPQALHSLPPLPPPAVLFNQPLPMLPTPAALWTRQPAPTAGPPAADLFQRATVPAVLSNPMDIWAQAVPPHLSDSFQRIPLPAPPHTHLPTSPFAVNTVQAAPRTVWQNQLKNLFHQNQAVIYALNIRTFGAEDKNGDGRISVRLGENGTFLSAVKNLDELKALGVNTIHLLPINPIGVHRRFGEGGSLYAPSDYHSLNPEFDTPGNDTDVLAEAKQFIEEAHKRGIHVMVDVPSCASYDLMAARPDLILKGPDGKPLTPTNWVDIVMFKNGPELQQYYEGFFDLMVNQLGVDGFRVDVARARPVEFWQHFISKYPDKAWLAETYTEEDASPLKNLPRDIPEQLLKAGFDSIYGQFHIFHSMANAQEYMNYLLENQAMFKRASQNDGKDKSFIGSFLTHDDPALMEKGGPLMCLLSSGLMATQPYTNPYILDGFTTGYTEHFDIFNFKPRHQGNNPEIGRFLNAMLNLRKQYEPIFSQGQFIPVPVNGGPNNQVIAFARHYNGRTMLVVANKNINARSQATLQVPGLNTANPLQNLAPEYGRASRFMPGANGQLQVDLGPGRFHLFEINTPNLPQQLPAY